MDIIQRRSEVVTQWHTWFLQPDCTMLRSSFHHGVLSFNMIMQEVRYRNGHTSGASATVMIM
jgi:hypothetical protein